MKAILLILASAFLAGCETQGSKILTLMIECDSGNRQACQEIGDDRYE